MSTPTDQPMSAEFNEQIKKMQAMLEQQKGQQGKNFLLAFIIEGDFNKVAGILSQMAEVPPAEGTEWLAAAIRFAGADMVKLILEKGVPITMPPMVVNATKEAQEWAINYRNTPYIVQAAMRGNLDIFNVLVEAGANIWEVGHIGFSRKRKNSIIGTSLAAAAYHGHYKLLQLLVKKASACLQDQVNMNCKEVQDVAASALIDAVKGKREQKPKDRVYQPEFVDFAPIMLAVVSEKANIGSVKDLLQAQANFGMHEKTNQDNLLHLAARWTPQVDILEYLVNNLTKDLLFERNKQGDTPMSICQQRKNQPAIELLEKVQKQNDQSDKKTEDLLKSLQEEEDREARLRAKRNEKKYKQKLDKLSKRDNCSKEETEQRLQEMKQQREREEQEKERKLKEQQARENQIVQQADSLRQQEVDRRQKESNEAKEAKKQKQAEQRALQKAEQIEKDRKAAVERSVPRPATAAPNKKERRATEQTERREQMRSVARSEQPAEGEEEQEETEDNKLAAQTPGAKEIVGLNGQLALNMMSKNKKKQLKKEMEEQERQEKELRDKILRKKEEEAAEQRRIRQDFERAEKAEEKRLKQELQKATDKVKKEQDGAQKGAQPKKAQAQQPAQVKENTKIVAPSMERVPHALDAVFQNQPKKLSKELFQGGGASRQSARAKSMSTKENLAQPLNNMVVEQKPAKAAKVYQKKAQVEAPQPEREVEKKEPKQKAKKEQRPVASTPAEGDEYQQMYESERHRCEQLQKRLERMERELDDVNADNLLLRQTVNSGNASQQHSQTELLVQLKRLQEQHQTQQQVNKALAAKVITFEKQILQDTKRRQELERLVQASGAANTVNLSNHNRINNYP